MYPQQSFGATVPQSFGAPMSYGAAMPQSYEAAAPTMQQSALQQYGVQQSYEAAAPTMQQPAPQQFGMPQAALQQFGMPQAAPQQFGMPQAAPQQFGMPQAAPQQFGMPQAAPQQFGMPQAAPQQFGMPQAAPQQFGMPQAAPQQFGMPQAAPQQFGMQQQYSVQQPAPQQFGMPQAAPQQFGMPQQYGAQQPALQQYGMPTLNTSQGGMMPTLNTSQGGMMPPLNTSQGGMMPMLNTSQGMMPSVQGGNPFARSSMVVSYANTNTTTAAPPPVTTATSSQLPVSFVSSTSTTVFSEPKPREKFVINSEMKQKASQQEVDFMQSLRSVLRDRLVRFVGISEDNVDVYLDDEIMIVWVRAFTHSTYSVYNYENLENLGDKLVGSIISKILHEIFSETMTPKTFSDISNYINSNAIFAKFINAMDLYGNLRKDPDAVVQETAIKGDLFESFCAALFLAGEHAMAKALEAPDRVNCAGFDLLYNLMQYCLLDIMQIVVVDASGNLTTSDEILKASFGAPKSLLLQMFNVSKTSKNIDNAFSDAIHQEQNRDILTKIFDAEPKCLNPNAVTEVIQSTKTGKDIFQNVFDKIFELDPNFFRKYRKYENADLIQKAIKNDSVRRVEMDTINAILRDNGFEECVVQKETNKMKSDIIFVRFTTKFTRTGRTLTIASALDSRDISSLILTMIIHLVKDDYASLKRILSSNVF